MWSWSISLICVLSAILVCQLPKAISTCGGGYQADEGILQFDAAEESTICIWTLRVKSQPFMIVLNSISQSTTIGIFSSDQAASAFPIIQPTITLNDSVIDRVFYSEASAVILVLGQSTQPVQRHFTLSWSVLQTNGTYDQSVSLNYIVNNQGKLQYNTYGLQVMANILDPVSSQGLNVEISIDSGDNAECTNSVHSIFEITAVGYLREIGRTCGPPFSLQNRRVPLLSFVVKPSPLQSETVKLQWSPGNSTVPEPTTTTPRPTEIPEPTTTEEEPTESPEPEFASSVDVCSEILIARTGLIRYNLTQILYSRCIWTVRSNRNERVRVQLMSSGYSSLDYLAILTFRNISNETVLHEAKRFLPNDFTPVDVNGPVFFVILSSSGRSIGTGFQLQFEGLVRPNEDDEEGQFEFTSDDALLDYSFTHFQYQSTPTNGTFAYPVQPGSPYQANEFVTVVFHRTPVRSGGNIWLKVSYADIEQSTNCSKDVLSIQAIGPTSIVSPVRDICIQNSNLFEIYNLGDYTEGDAANSVGFIMVFRSDGNGQYQGFRGSHRYSLNVESKLTHLADGEE